MRAGKIICEYFDSIFFGKLGFLPFSQEIRTRNKNAYPV
jgi:hypothetical protein